MDHLSLRSVSSARHTTRTYCQVRATVVVYVAAGVMLFQTTQFSSVDCILRITEHYHYATGFSQNWAPAGTLRRAQRDYFTDKLNTYLAGYSTTLPVPFALSNKLRGLSLYRPSDHRMSAKLVPTFADRRYRVVSATDPYCHNLGGLKPRSLVFSLVAIERDIWTEKG
jgi:hypothetical protein